MLAVFSLDFCQWQVRQMRIAMVIDQYDNETSGPTVSTARFVEHLRKRGHEVRIIATGKPKEGKYCVPAKIFPVINPLISSQGMIFGRSDDTVVREALQGVDIVHLQLPFRLCMRVREIAEEMGIPYIGAFHCQPENITSSIGLQYFAPLNHWLYAWFNHRFYRYVKHIHCPSDFIANELKKHHYKAKLHVISNGADEAFIPVAVSKPAEWEDKYVILMVGRLSAEKRQDLIIKAVLRSRYQDKIQLVFLGKGPLYEKYRLMGEKLKNKPIFGYYPKDELVRVINQCDLYVHASEAEIEAIACIEAFSCGLVPIISDSRKSATGSFALDERCLFRNRNAADLCRKIEYMIEHPEEKAKIREKFLAAAPQYRVTRSVEKMEQVYQSVIEKKRRNEKTADEPDAHEIHLPTTLAYSIDENYPFVCNSALKTILTTVIAYGLLSPFFYALVVLLFGYRVDGKQNLKKLNDGAVTVCNHAHALDTPMVIFSLFPRKPYITSLQTNFEIPYIGSLIRFLGSVPIPQSPKALAAFMDAMEHELQKGRLVHFYPEASLRPDICELRPFKCGAFHLAVQSGKPVVPIVLKYRNPGKWVKLINKKPLVSIVIGEPVRAPAEGTRKERIKALKESIHTEMEKMLAG
jgi:1,2-diacylglycerol 3-alpha-glucosyltransferase